MFYIYMLAYNGIGENLQMAAKTTDTASSREVQTITEEFLTV